MFGEAKELKDLHKDLQEANYIRSEMEDVILPLQFLYQTESKPPLAHEEEGSSLDDYGGDFFGGEHPHDSILEEHAPSLDAIFYDDSGPKASKRKKKYKRKDWEFLVPLGGPRHSGRVKACSGARLLGLEEASF